MRIVAYTSNTYNIMTGSRREIRNCSCQENEFAGYHRVWVGRKGHMHAIPMYFMIAPPPPPMVARSSRVSQPKQILRLLSDIIVANEICGFNREGPRTID